ncbi:MAG: hypothetical protein MUE30_08540 [Spirosomaceae bacterium]|jgi:hypothetical protein|nr:hypothetical protein [Spirosomataceae bacterium]
MNSAKLFLACLFFSVITVYAQKKEPIRYFSREVTIQDSLTLSLIDDYIHEQPNQKVLSLSIGYINDTIFYKISAIDSPEVIINVIKPFFIAEHKGYKILVSNGIGSLLGGNDAFPQFIASKLNKDLRPMEKIKKSGQTTVVTLRVFDPPTLRAKRKKGFVVKYWN